MLGEFHRLSGVQGLHNKEFRPLRSPLPMLTIRHMVATDWLFVSESIESARAWFARFHPGEDSEVFLGHIRKLAEVMRKMGQEGTGQTGAKTT